MKTRPAPVRCKNCSDPWMPRILRFLTDDRQAHVLVACTQAARKARQANNMLSLCWRSRILMARPGRHAEQHMACTHQHAFLHGEDELSSLAIPAANMAQVKQYRQNKTCTLAPSKEPALCCHCTGQLLFRLAQTVTAVTWDSGEEASLNHLFHHRFKDCVATRHPSSL